MAQPKTLRVTIGAAATQVCSNSVFTQQVFFQNNGSNPCRVGDSNASMSTPQGILLSSGSPGDSMRSATFYETDLFYWYIAGTQGDVIDVLFVQ
jgi:PPE-repeat protein